MKCFNPLTCLIATLVTIMTYAIIVSEIRADTPKRPIKKSVTAPRIIPDDDMPLPHRNRGSEAAIRAKRSYRHHTPRRDQDDEFWTFRFKVSDDGGENWSDIHGTGDTGMWEINGRDTTSVYSSISEDFGAVVDGDNNLHFIAVLNRFSDYNPQKAQAQLVAAIKEKLLVLRDDVIAYPGHGPETTIGREKATNPFL